jgi:transposase
VISRETGEQRFGVCDHADRRTCAARIAENVPLKRTLLDTGDWQSAHGSPPAHATVRHGSYDWARDDDGDGRRDGHCNACEGAGAALRTYLRAFRGVHKQYLPRYVATYAAMVNTTRVTPTLIQSMCARAFSAYAGYT